MHLDLQLDLAQLHTASIHISLPVLQLLLLYGAPLFCSRCQPLLLELSAATLSLQLRSAFLARACSIHILQLAFPQF